MQIKKLLALILLAPSLFAGRARAQEEPVDYVNPLIETTKSRYFYFNSACRPFGMVNLSPDNILEKEWNSGYKYQEPFIRGLTHIHDWGAGGLLVMPTMGNVNPTAGPEEWKSPFSHDKEQVSPGYHRVFLDKYATKVELTSTVHAGFHKYTFDNEGEARILVSLGGELGGGIMKDAYVKKVNGKEIAGWVDQKTSVGEVRLFFVIQLDKPFKDLVGWKGKQLAGKVTDTIAGDQLGVYATYNVAKGQVLKARVGVSWCSIEQARLNLSSEIAHWDFEKVKQESRDDWNQWLKRIEVKGGTKENRVKFYTDLWHALLGRRQIQDVNGKYPDYMSGKLKVKQLPLNDQGKPKFMHLSTDALWMTMWNLNILWGAAYPEVLESFVNSSMVYYKDGGHLPRGPVIGKESWIMTSSPVSELIVGAYMLGLRNYDIDSVYQALKKAHMPGSTMDYGGGFVQDYIDKGYAPEQVPAEGWGGAGRTMEYVTQDWALAQLARKLGKEEDARYFLKRSGNWVNLFDPAIGFIRPRHKDGSWLTPFDPLANANFGGFVEANTWQTTWMAVHDVQGLVNLLGGKDKYCDKLNFAFEKARADKFVGGYGNNYVNYSNQPGLAMAHLFNYAGKPWLSQYWVREVYSQTFSDVTPYGGYGGNDEDQGQMAALSALMAIGIFDIKGGCDPEPMYQITTPLFEEVTIHLNPRYYAGGKFTITTKNNSPENRYIQSAQLNGKALDQCWFYQKDFKKGGSLSLTLGALPNKNWGLANMPPSETQGEPDFELSNLNYPKEVAAGAPVAISYEVENKGSMGTYFSRITSGDVLVGNQELVFKQGEKRKLSHVVRLYKTGSGSISIDNQQVPIRVTYKKSVLEFMNTAISNIGENIHIKTTVLNNGSDNIHKPVVLRINKKMVKEEVLRLLPGEKRELEFSYTAPSSGLLSIDVNGAIKKDLTILSPVCRSENGLVLFYDFGDQHTPLLDLSCNKQYPLAGKHPGLQSKLGRAALRFENTHHLKFLSSDKLNARGSLAFSIVLSPNRWNSFARVLQKGNGDDQYMVYRNGDEKLEFKLTDVQNGRISFPLPQVNKWTHLVCQYNKEAGKLQVWMNGELVAEQAASGAIRINDDPLYVGTKNERSGLEDSFEGFMKQLRIYSRALSDKEVQGLYQGWLSAKE